MLQTAAGLIRVYRPPTEWVPRVQPAWHPNGTQVALLTDNPDGDAGLVVADAATGAATVVAAEVPGARHGSVYPLAWSPDGRWLAAGGLMLDAAVGWDARGRALVVRWEGARHRWQPECC